MNDIVNIRLSKDANDIAERLVATGKFENVVTAAKFALAYALKNYFDECDPSTYSIPDSSGSNIMLVLLIMMVNSLRYFEQYIPIQTRHTFMREH